MELVWIYLGGLIAFIVSAVCLSEVTRKDIIEVIVLSLIWPVTSVYMLLEKYVWEE